VRFKSRLEAASPLRGASLHARSGAGFAAWREPLEIAFVNNMPDLAATATHAQFFRLVRSALGDAPFNFRCYVSPHVPRSEGMRRQLHQTHDNLDALFARGADALIVTGAEPRAALLTEEPYWSDLAHLVDWARDHTSTSLWSCLAAHAAVQHLEGIMRRRAAEKFSGVYAFEKSRDDWLMRGDGATIVTPHSRYNGLARSELEQSGYHISSWSESVGVNIFWRREPSRFVFAQGHPEYDAQTLLREYRRDAIRFLMGERDSYPSVPDNYFSARTEARLESFKASASARGRNGCEEDLDAILADEIPAFGWGADATRLYRNWLAPVVREKRLMASQSGKMRTALLHASEGSGPSGALGLKV
jgi:homoserine O-succinyltransferase